MHQNETYTVRQETVQIEGATVTASAAISAGSAEASLHTLQVLLGILVPIYLALAIAQGISWPNGPSAPSQRSPRPQKPFA